MLNALFPHQVGWEAKGVVKGEIMVGLVENKRCAFFSNESFLQVFRLEERNTYDASLLFGTSRLFEEQHLQGSDCLRP